MTEKLTIVFSNAAKSWGGGEKWMLSAAMNLAARGHRIFFGIRTGSPLAQRAESANFETLDFNIRGTFAPAKTIRITRMLRKISPHIMVLNFNKDVRVAGLAARIARVPVNIARHGAPIICNRLRHRLTLKLVDGIITNTNSIRDLYATYGWIPQDFVRVIYNGVSVPRSVQPMNLRAMYNTGDNFIFAAAGRLCHEKGFDILIESAAILKREGLPIRFLVAGEGSLLDELRARATELDVTEQVRFIGFVDTPLPFIKGANAFVLPSRMEGMPNVVLEAMALGVVPIAAAVNGVPELISHGENGFIVAPQNAKTLADGIRYVFEHRDMLEQIGENGKSTVEAKFTFEHMTDDLEAFFSQRLLNSPNTKR